MNLEDEYKSSTPTPPTKGFGPPLGLDFEGKIRISDRVMLAFIGLLVTITTLVLRGS